MTEDKYFYPKKFINGGIAGIIGKTIVAPIDRIKIIYMVRLTRFQKKDSHIEKD
jgi:hypothetical protein